MNLTDLLSKHLFDIISTTIALASMCTAAYFSIRSARSASLSLEHERRSLEHSSASLKLSERTVEHEELALILSYTNSVRVWGDDVMETLSESIILCEIDPKRARNFFERRNDNRKAYFRLIDTGRWFFPNDNEDNYGQWKPRAYQGLTQDVIHSLKKSLDAVGELNYVEAANNYSLRQEIVNQKRNICSEIFLAINPKKVSAAVKERIR